ncbi:NB-ARC domain-containing protein [Actinoplanes sp. NPDC051343]|uniref:NB-ARC domain-containing protein n=1 Tax=Actinoplanes sp. NPDC051343 TaxID=3363906 RepID=UPI0037A8291D
MAQVPEFLARILGPDGRAAGTGFQVASGFLVTACHILADLDCDRLGAALRTDALAANPLDGPVDPIETVVIVSDARHDLAVLHRAEPLPASVSGLVPTDSVDPLTRVVATGVAQVDDREHVYRHLDATGTWEGGTLRDGVSLGRLSSSALVRGMSGAPVLRISDNAAIGVVSARYNSVDGWLRDSVWVARIEDLMDLMEGIAEITVSRRVLLAEPVRTVLSVVTPARYALSRLTTAAPILALQGPHEAALEATKVLMALDDSCQGLGKLDDVVESLVGAAVRAGQHDEREDRELRDRLRVRGLDPRVLVPALAGHDEAWQRWTQPTPGASGPVTVAVATRLLGSLARALTDELKSPMFAGLSSACRQYLREALLSTDSPSLPAFLSAMAAILPPPRSTSVEAVLVHSENGSSATAEPPATYYRREKASIAAQMCRLPDPDPYLTGRSHLIGKIVRAITDQMARKGSATAFLSGQPGVGTSTVGIEAARRLTEVFPGGVFHVDLHGLAADTRRDIPTVIRILAEALGLDLGEGPIDQAGRLAVFAARLRDRRVLLVLDNALNAAHVSMLTGALTGAAIIVTSRDRMQSYADRGLVFRVEPLARDASVEMLSILTGEQATQRRLLQRIAHLCADVPLALQMIGARIVSRPDLSLDYLLHILEEETTRLDYLDAGDRAVRAAIKLSYDNLDQAAQRVMRLVAASPGAALTGTELGHCVGGVALQQELLLNRLVDRSLAEQHVVRSFAGSILATFNLFDLVLLFAKERLADEETEETVRDFQLRAVSHLRDRLAEVAGTDRGVDLSAELDPSRFHAAERLAESRQWLDLALELATGLHDLYEQRGELDRVVAVNETRVHLHLSLGESDAAVTLCLLNADLLGENARPQAVDCARRAAGIAAEHGLLRRVAEAEFKVSLLLWADNDHAGALAAGERAGALINVGGQDSVLVPVAINNCKLAREMGDIEKALSWGRTATELADRLSDGNLRASAAFNLARAQHHAGRHDVAIESGRRAEMLYQVEKNWWNSAVAAQNAALSAEQVGDTSAAVRLRKRAIEHWERRGLASHLVDSMVELSALHARLGAYELAGQVLEQAARAGSDAPALLGAEVRMRYQASRLFVGTEPGNLGSEIDHLFETLASSAPGDVEKVDAELDRIQGVLDRFYRGALSTPEARRQTQEFLVSGTRNKVPPAPEWLHQDLGAQAANRAMLNGS